MKPDIKGFLEDIKRIEKEYDVKIPVKVSISITIQKAPKP